MSGKITASGMLLWNWISTAVFLEFFGHVAGIDLTVHSLLRSCRALVAPS